MKKLVSCLAAAIALVVGGSSAGASTPAADPDLALSPSTVMAGTSFQAVLTGCSVDETVNFAIEDTDLEAVTAACTGPGQTASAMLLAPTLGGPWTVTATSSTSGATASATVNVTGGEEEPVEMPTTGSNSLPIALVGAGLVAVGATLALVAGVRRNKANTVQLG